LCHDYTLSEDGNFATDILQSFQISVERDPYWVPREDAWSFFDTSTGCADPPERSPRDAHENDEKEVHDDRP
jgi:hypothetical protein